MVELREQLGALLRLEEKYETRDYLLDLTSQNNDVSDATASQNDSSEDSRNPTLHQDQDVTNGEESPQSALPANEEGVLEGGNSDPSLLSGAAFSSTKITVITEKHAVAWRGKICEWSYQVADHFDLTRDLVYIALNYLDRVIAASDTGALLQDKNRFQLLAMASLCLAIKLHGGMDTNYPGTEESIVETILMLGRGYFTAQQLKEMESDILQRLQWRLNPPTPQAIISYIFELFPVEEKTEIIDIALYIIELSVHDYCLISSKPSVLALAALSNAARMLGHTDAWMNGIQEDLSRHDGYEEAASLDACKDRLDRLYTNTGTKLEDFVDVTSLMNNRMDGMYRELSPTSVIN